MTRDEDGPQRYERFVQRQMSDPEFARIYREESEKKELWLALVETRQAAGLTQAELARRLGVSQAQVARIERNGYEAHTLNTLRRYVAAIGDDYVVEVRITRRGARPRTASVS